ISAFARHGVPWWFRTGGTTFGAIGIGDTRSRRPARFGRDRKRWRHHSAIVLSTKGTQMSRPFFARSSTPPSPWPAHLCRPRCAAAAQASEIPLLPNLHSARDIPCARDPACPEQISSGTQAGAVDKATRTSGFFLLIGPH